MIPQRMGLSPLQKVRRTTVDFLALTKPRLVSMVLVTAFAGFYLGSGGKLDGVRLFQTLLGVALAAGGAMALNQYLECEVDALMKRTQHRPLPDGRLRPMEALIFGISLTFAGLLYLRLTVNKLSSIITVIIVSSYLFVYTPLKRKTLLSSFVGAIPGALPPVIGWIAAQGRFDVGAGVLFAILFFWQIPHNLAIAWMCRYDYAQAGVRVLPVVHQDGHATGLQCVIHSLGLLVMSLFPSLIGMAGWTYFGGAFVLGVAFLACGISFRIVRSAQTARRLLLASYVYLPTLFGMMVLDNAALWA